MSLGRQVLTAVAGMSLYAAAMPAVAATLYVNGTTGNDANDGLSATDQGGGAGPKQTIQAAVTAAGSGGTVVVAPGTYSETPNINGTSEFVLTGSDAEDRPVIANGLTLGSSGNTSLTLSHLKIEGAASATSVVSNTGLVTSLTMDNVKVDGLSVAGRYGVIGNQIGGEISILNCEFANIVGASGAGWAAFDTRSGAGSNDGANITRVTLFNTLLTNCQGHIAFRHHSTTLPYPPVSITSNTVELVGNSVNSFGGIIKVFRGGDVVFSGNLVKDVGTSGFNPASEAAYGAGFMPRQVNNLTCTGNTFENCNQGIAIEPNRPVPAGIVADNIFRGNTYGLYVPSTATAPFGELVIVNNAFESNVTAGIHNGSVNDTLVATNNWWGSAAGPSGGNGASGQVTTDPWNGKSDQEEDDFAQPAAASSSAALSVTAGGVTCGVDLAPAAGTFDGSESFLAYGETSVTQGFAGFSAPGGIGRSLFLNTGQTPGTVIATVKIGYEDPADLAGFVESELFLAVWDATAAEWVPAVSLNTAGTPQWVGDSPAAAPTAANLGKYGVDLTGNVVWAVVDHASQYAAGSGSGTSTVPVSVSAFAVE